VCGLRCDGLMRDDSGHEGVSRNAQIVSCRILFVSVFCFGLSDVGVLGLCL
jgi:hypothetical protein